MARASISESPGSTARLITIEIERQFDASSEASAIRQAIKSAAKDVAEKWIEENRDKVMERLNVDAIANMIMIEVANGIKKDIREEDKNESK